MNRFTSRRRRSSRPVRAALMLATIPVLPLAACGGGSDPVGTGSSLGAGASGSSSAAGGIAITVGAADYSESQILAAIYAGALKAKGVNASTSSPIGSREVYLKALGDGSINVMPEYTGSLALYYDKNLTATDPQQVYDALTKLVPATLTVLKPSAAEDKNSVTVTKETADQLKLTRISDLSGKAGELTMGAPPEFKIRPQGAPGLTRVYGFSFKSYPEMKGQQLVQALKNGQVNAANIFTTDPSIKANDFVVLEDDKLLFVPENVVPLVAKSAATPEVTKVLDGVSAKLTTEGLRDLLTKVDVDKQDVAKVADEWLGANGLK